MQLCVIHYSISFFLYFMPYETQERKKRSTVQDTDILHVFITAQIILHFYIYKRQEQGPTARVNY